MADARNGSSAPSSPRDLSQGVIVVFSGGPVDIMNPTEVLERMDQLISDVNTDPFVLANSGGEGLKFKLLPNQEVNHIHQSRWPEICEELQLVTASPVILVGHSNGGAAVIDLARCLHSKGKSVDLAFTADSVLTLNDNGDVNKVPSNVRLNLNPYVIPTPRWWEAPFPFGRQNRRETDNALDGILNIGLPFYEPGVWAHRDAFYDLTGGDERSGVSRHPEMLREMTLAVLRSTPNEEIFQLAQSYLQVLANETRIAIELETATFKTTLVPAAETVEGRIETARLPQSQIEHLQDLMIGIEKQRLSAF
jgi:hypothetical protein